MIYNHGYYGTTAQEIYFPETHHFIPPSLIILNIIANYEGALPPYKKTETAYGVRLKD